nr:hypothetical protein GCM10020092_049760 [Actinoplanes digitatis]
MLGALHQRQVEDDEPGRGDAGEPEPLRAARPYQPGPAEPGEGDKQQAGQGVARRLGGEQGRVGEDPGDGDAAADADHADRASGDGK